MPPADLTTVRLASEPFDPTCLSIVSASQAWAHLVLPLRIDGGALIAATTEETYDHVADLLGRVYDGPVHLVLAEIRPLEQFIAERYDYEGLDVPEAA